jgi:hypothetical protein
MRDEPTPTVPPQAARAVFLARVITALAQAALLYWLTDALAAPQSWVVHARWVFEPLLLVSAFVPLILIAGLGPARPRVLAVWAGAAAVIVAGLGLHDATREAIAGFSILDRAGPPFPLWVALTGGLFIAHGLVEATAREGRFPPSHASLFDTATRLAVRAVLAGAFTGGFWMLLGLGVGMFHMLAVDWPGRLIWSPGFAFPATTLAVAAAVQATDARMALIAGIRSLVLGLFAWLLPLLVAILAAFLGSLLVLSPAPLWATHAATAILLTAAIGLILLINSAYQDGAAERPTSRFAHWAIIAGAVELAPITGLAIWAIGLRVAQYGWTVDRILATSVIVVVAGVAAGYLSTAVGGAGRLRRIERTNQAMALVVVAVILALFSPVADPGRLMVADQVARLRSGAIPADRFDFAALRLDGARWGAAALSALSHDSSLPDPAIRSSATWALAQTNRSMLERSQTLKPVPNGSATRVKVHPDGRTLPDGFLEAAFGPRSGRAVPVCLRVASGQCDVRFVTLRPGEPEVLVFLDTMIAFVFAREQTGTWTKIGDLTGPLLCPDLRQAFVAGEVDRDPHPWPDLMIGGQRVVITSVPEVCPRPRG